MSPAGSPGSFATRTFSRSREAPASPFPPSRSFVPAVATLIVLSAAACGDAATGPAPTPNSPPVRIGAIPTQSLGVGESVMLNVAAYFNDPDGDALAYVASSSNSGTASVAVAGSVLTITAITKGVVSVTVTASDPGGLSAQQTLTVTVPNQGPTAVDSVPAQTVFVSETASVDMAAYFNDPDGDALAYSVASSNVAAVTASVEGSLVSLTAITRGTSTVTVTARDPDGLSAEQNIAVTIPNRAPTALDTIPSRTLLAGNTLEFDLARYFTDPDGDALTFTVASANAGVASVESVGSTLTITGRAPGSTRVTVTVADPAGMAIQQLFAVTVPNREPVAIGAIPGQSVVSGQTATIDASPFFNDPDGQTLSYAAASSNRTVATAAVAGATVTLTGVVVGTASITVTGHGSGRADGSAALLGDGAGGQ